MLYFCAKKSTFISIFIAVAVRMSRLQEMKSLFSLKCLVFATGKCFAYSLCNDDYSCDRYSVECHVTSSECVCLSKQY